LENELHSLGIVEPKQKKEPKDNKEELENLANSIKQAMFQDYKLVYSEAGDTHKEEAKSTLTLG
jgi:archaellum component FlaC